ncbi:transcriptional regulator [Nostoc linckia z18]|jgi:DNA-binding phage protein|uniref:Transcriptional regulator n=2 Tax=Nostoc linckia TaxID=92942 RepID=A0A9Q5ZCY9_NOSLI|nr:MULTISPECIES: transcriptional regulator [Nostoc]PHK40278.1 transcriptional regulator [Nostoc linckia z15]PHK45358.1 transcriptional regulator [Nostoc linckia z16]MBC1235810.1 transcriptional regulator [Nostoc sp. 2RC]PHJ59227.1 transcriptional regulator [Nostoc linckia z1]PHJ69717.1 transcriptional regulator [Nostoc linckia z2]
MKRVKTPTSDSYQEYLIESLKDPEEAAAYIEAILEAEEPEAELLTSALKDVIDARLKMNSLSEQAKKKWEQLSESNGAEIYNLVALLDALGFRLAVTLK